jgi:histidinol-phosphate phosphatase family protein
MSARRAAFLDRDGTLIADAHYLADPAGIREVTGAAEAVRALNAEGVAVVVVTNQSGIARGLLTEADYAAVDAELRRRFAAHGAVIDASYHCPHHPDVTGPCGCRKPGTLLFERAAHDLDLDLGRSLYVGDRWRDVVPGLVLRGRPILVPSPETPEEDLRQARHEIEVADDLLAAVRRFLDEGRGVTRSGGPG